MKLQVEPICIFVSSKADSALVEACRQPPLSPGASSGHAVPLHEPQGLTVKAERASCFQYSQVIMSEQIPPCACILTRTHPCHYAQAIRALDLIKIQGMPPDLPSLQDRLNFFNSLVDLSKEDQISALGALLIILQRVQIDDLRSALMTEFIFLVEVLGLDFLLMLCQDGLHCGMHRAIDPDDEDLNEQHQSLSEIHLQGLTELLLNG